VSSLILAQMGKNWEENLKMPSSHLPSKMEVVMGW